MTLTEFLLARIAEDEAVARDASPGPWHAADEEVLAVDGITVCDAFALSGPQLRATADHIARHDPARVLAECEAKRRIVENAARAREACGSAPLSERVSASDGPVSAYWRGQDWACKTLAAVYAGHPDYRAEWAV